MKDAKQFSLKETIIYDPDPDPDPGSGKYRLPENYQFVSLMSIKRYRRMFTHFYTALFSIKTCFYEPTFSGKNVRLGPPAPLFNVGCLLAHSWPALPAIAFSGLAQH